MMIIEESLSNSYVQGVASKAVFEDDADQHLISMLTSANEAESFFKPYRLWESSFMFKKPEESPVKTQQTMGTATADEPFKNDNFTKRSNGASYDFSVFSSQHANNEKKENNKTYGFCNINENRGDESAKCTSFYSLWASPNIVDFLPSIGGFFTLARGTNERSDGIRDPNTTSNSSQTFSAGPMIATSHITFTDRGAFEYYRKPMANQNYIDEMGSFCKDCTLSSSDSSSLSKMTSSWSSTTSCASSSIFMSSPSQDATNDNEDMIQFSAHHFKPIQPAFRVTIDPPPSLRRSATSSRTYRLHDRMLLVYTHERNKSKETSPSEFVFEPKLFVSDNNKACQTEITLLCKVAP